jgi:Protein of unknown function (DUF3617)
MLPSRFAALGLLTAIVFMACSPASALEIQPGQWRSSEVHTMNGKTDKPEITSDCVSAEEARDPVKALAQLKGAGRAQCRAFDVKQTGNVVSFVMKCGDAKQGSIDLAAVYTFADARHYSGAIKTTMSIMGRKIVSDMTIDARWLGAACK